MGNIAGDHGFRPIAEPGEKHFHLLTGRILGFIQYDKGVIERPAPHKCQRSHFNHAALNHFLSAAKVNHIVQGVIQRPQIGINFFGQIAWQKTQLLPSLDGRPGENNPTHFTFHEFSNRHRHRQIRFPGASRPDTEYDIVVADSIDVGFLSETLGRNSPVVGRYVDCVEKNILKIGSMVTAEDTDRVIHITRIDGIAALDEIVQLGRHPTRQVAL